MFSRLLGVPVLLAAAVGVPYLATNGPNIEGLFGSTPAQSSTSIGIPIANTSSPYPSPAAGTAFYPQAGPPEGLATVSLYEVFNMNVTKEWVYQRWARKSTAHSDLGLYGIRVPLVTGTQLHDLAGSLTYFFGSDGRVSRISFHGTTGDTSQLVRLVTQQYGLQPQTSPISSEQLFQVRRKHQVLSELRTRPAAVLRSSSPHDSFTVDLQLQRPGLATPLPSQLPPLPSVQAPRQQPSPQAQRSVAKKREQPVAKQQEDPSKKWDVFFPRSRVPGKQVDGLDRRGRMW